MGVTCAIGVVQPCHVQRASRKDTLRGSSPSGKSVFGCLCLSGCGRGVGVVKGWADVYGDVAELSA